jgi:ABC-2 type transport system permease protein
VALGLVFAAANVFFMDSENFVDLITNVTTWFSPVIYHFTQISKIQSMPHWLMTIYFLNPITSAVELFHYAFWNSAISAEDKLRMPEITSVEPNLLLHAGVSLGGSIILLFIGQLIFHKFEGRFAQEL